MAAIVDERLAQTFVELADTLVGGFDLMEFLHMLTERCVELLEVDAAGLLLADAGGVRCSWWPPPPSRPGRGAVPDPERRGPVPGQLPHRAAGHRR